MGGPSKKPKAALPQEAKPKEQPEVKKEPSSNESNITKQDSDYKQPIQSLDSKEAISPQPTSNVEIPKPLENVAARGTFQNK